MASQKKSVGKTWRSPVNWSLQAHQWVMAVSHVAAMSFGVEPKLASITLAKGDKAFAASFVESKQLLGRKMSIQPDENQAIYFPLHGYNDSKTVASNRMVVLLTTPLVLQMVDAIWGASLLFWSVPVAAIARVIYLFATQAQNCHHHDA